MKQSLLLVTTILLHVFTSQAQNDTMYIMKSGVVVAQYNTITQVDSVIFYNPVSNPIDSIFIPTVNIPSGTFTMGSPINDLYIDSDEIEHVVTLSAFRMSKYEITNAQYASFLNAKSIDYKGIYADGSYPTEKLLSYSSNLRYKNGQWLPESGYENYPVTKVTWFGAAEFALYVGGSLPTEAQWEYACRAGSTTPFNTGDCLSDTQANYDWSTPYSNCTNANTKSLHSPQQVGCYAPNAFGLFDMHGNVWEWCNDWYGMYSSTPQTNPTGAETGMYRVFRGGSWMDIARSCRSARRYDSSPDYGDSYLGFRLVFPK